MQKYYSRQAFWYDATRWSFLHGRNELLRRLELRADSRQTLLEVGCGTGRNLVRLARQYPGLQLIGVDVSKDMLARATRSTLAYSRRIRLFEAPYAPNTFALNEPIDVVLFSYSLTMFNPGWEAALDRAVQDLHPGGKIAVVDFHNTPSGLFRRWMRHNHVRMDGHLLPALQERFQTLYFSTRSAAAGLWQYFLFVGEKA
ncbi:MAG: methyltransferase domain-containing protein [Saprospiraceae bacterium]|nr:methyltransferase domain-containing protein [Saprospiraceae bacterium]